VKITLLFNKFSLCVSRWWLAAGFILLQSVHLCMLVWVIKFLSTISYKPFVEISPHLQLGCSWDKDELIRFWGQKVNVTVKLITFTHYSSTWHDIVKFLGSKSKVIANFQRRHTNRPFSVEDCLVCWMRFTRHPEDIPCSCRLKSLPNSVIDFRGHCQTLLLVWEINPLKHLPC